MYTLSRAFSLYLEVGEGGGVALPCGHEVVVVVHPQESLELGPVLHLLFAHLSGDFTGVTVDPRYQGVTVRFVLCTIIVVLK